MTECSFQRNVCMKDKRKGREFIHQKENMIDELIRDLLPSSNSFNISCTMFAKLVACNGRVFSTHFTSCTKKFHLKQTIWWIIVVPVTVHIYRKVEVKAVLTVIFTGLSIYIDYSLTYSWNAWFWWEQCHREGWVCSYEGHAKFR